MAQLLEAMSSEDLRKEREERKVWLGVVVTESQDQAFF
jgi:hypothetical protein